jgi:hypothetical protein
LLAAVAFEHASRAPILGIEHFPKELGLLAAMGARRDRVGSKPEKTSFLNSLFIKSPAGGSRGLKLQTEHLFQKMIQPRIWAWNDLLTPRTSQRQMRAGWVRKVRTGDIGRLLEMKEAANWGGLTRLSSATDRGIW